MAQRRADIFGKVPGCSWKVPHANPVQSVQLICSTGNRSHTRISQVPLMLRQGFLGVLGKSLGAPDPDSDLPDSNPDSDPDSDLPDSNPDSDPDSDLPDSNPDSDPDSDPTGNR